MTKNQRIENLERIVRTLVNIVGWVIPSGKGYLEISQYEPTLSECLKVIYDELGINYIFLETPGKRNVKVHKKTKVKK